MGLPSPSSGRENAKIVVSGSFAGTGQSGDGVPGLQAGSPGNNPAGTIPPVFSQLFNMSLAGTFVATVQLEKSFDGGATWRVVSLNTQGAPAIYTAPVNLVVFEPENSIRYRWNCTAFTSGPVDYRISQ